MSHVKKVRADMQPRPLPEIGNLHWSYYFTEVTQLNTGEKLPPFLNSKRSLAGVP